LGLGHPRRKTAGALRLLFCLDGFMVIAFVTGNLSATVCNEAYQKMSMNMQS